MKEAYLTLRRLVQLTNQVIDFFYGHRTPADILTCENAMRFLYAQFMHYQATCSGMEIQLGRPGIRAVENADEVVGFIMSVDPQLRGGVLKTLADGTGMGRQLPFATSGVSNLFAATRKPVVQLIGPNPKGVDDLDDAYQTWLSRSNGGQKAEALAPIEETVALTKPEPAKAKVRRNKLQESRDKWIYTQAKNGDKTYRKIMLELAKLSVEKGWRKLGSPQAVEQAADRYVVRHNLKPLPPRMER